ncbi:hypothetical protein K438DRAFT_1762483 [Mycena galopus ATCC 62051]|nr:hypothetical protein K438DRAFT_1762483 [Mycena galopus ATCC 62051]
MHSMRGLDFDASGRMIRMTETTTGERTRWRAGVVCPEWLEEGGLGLLEDMVRRICLGTMLAHAVKTSLAAGTVLGKIFWQLIPFPQRGGNGCVAEHKFLIMRVELAHRIVLGDFSGKEKFREFTNLIKALPEVRSSSLQPKFHPQIPRSTAKSQVPPPNPKFPSNPKFPPNPKFHPPNAEFHLPNAEFPLNAKFHPLNAKFYPKYQPNAKFHGFR